MVFVRGPVFANMILADEINRTPPKTQAALLEAMQEHQVTAAGLRHPLEEPFFVLATQNPIEMEGTYPLARGAARPLHVQRGHGLPAGGRGSRRGASRPPPAVRRRSSRSSPAKTCLRFHELVRQVPIAEDLVRYAVRLTAASSRPQQKGSPGFVNDWVSWGAGTRAGQSLVPGGQGARAAARPDPCVGRGHPCAGRARAAPSRSRELPRGSRGHECRNDHPAAARKRGARPGTA
jgi:MoxR-like ATPase